MPVDMVLKGMFRSGRDREYEHVENLRRKLSSDTVVLVNVITLQRVDSYLVFMCKVILFE